MSDPIFWMGAVLGGGVVAIIFTLVSYFVIREERRVVVEKLAELEGYDV